MNKWVLVGVVVACNACADVMNTAGMRNYGKVEHLNPSGIARLVRALSRNRYIIGGVIANAVGFFTFMSLLSIAPVSFADPATSASFVIEAGLAKLILKEAVHWQRWLAVFAIGCGVMLLALP